MGPGVAQWLRHCGTSRTVPGSNLGGEGRRDFSRGYRQNHGVYSAPKNEYQGFLLG